MTKSPIEKVHDLIAGRGPASIKLKLAEVDAKGGGGCRNELADAIAGHPEIGYYHDPFRDYWILSRSAPPDLFSGVT